MAPRRRLTRKQPAARSPHVGAGVGPDPPRRLRGKQPPADRSSLFRAAVHAQAHALECADDILQPLGPKVRRNHVHCTHVRTRDPSHRQPESFTRKAFYEHMETCYRLAYPDSDSLAGSILMFGVSSSTRTRF